MSLTIENQIEPEFTELERQAFARAGACPRAAGGATAQFSTQSRRRAYCLLRRESNIFSAIIQQLVELRQEEEADEYGTLRANEQAFDAACSLVIDAAIISARDRRPIPRGCASTDSEGGIRIEWVRPTASVHLVIPAGLKHEAYIYYEAIGFYSTEPASPDLLASRLSSIS